MSKQSIETKEYLGYRLRLKQWLWRIRIALHSYIKSSLSKPIFVLSFPRTGSSLLMQNLAQYREVTDCGEILNQRIAKGLNHRKRGTNYVISHIKLSIGSQSANYSAVKLHFNHLEKRDVSLLDILGHFPEALYIFLYRESILEQFCSARLASSTRQFHSAIRTDMDKVEVSLEEWNLFRNKVINTYRESLQFICDYSKPINFVAISYEQLVKKNLDHLICALESYEVDCLSVNITELRLVKQDSRNIVDIISNYEIISPHLGIIKISFEDIYSEILAQKRLDADISSLYFVKENAKGGLSNN